MYPVSVQNAMVQRQRAAESAYECVKSSCDDLGMSREQYVAAYIANLPALTWISTGSTDGRVDSQLASVIA